MGYDSITSDTIPHKINYEKVMRQVIEVLEDEAKNHDNSKMAPPEVGMYDEYIPKLQAVKYGTPEYTKLRDSMASTEGLRHHYESNDHHPEFFGDEGVGGMDLIQMLKCLVDWRAAALRSDTSFEEGLKFNQKRFGFSDSDLKRFIMTAKALGWVPKEYK